MCVLSEKDTRILDFTWRSFSLTEPHATKRYCVAFGFEIEPFVDLLSLKRLNFEYRRCTRWLILCTVWMPGVLRRGCVSARGRMKQPPGMDNLCSRPGKPHAGACFVISRAGNQEAPFVSLRAPGIFI